MKKLIIVLCICLFLCGCVFHSEINYVPEYVPDGYVSHEKYLEKDRWMDVVDYYVYKYDGLPVFSENFKPLKADENGKADYIDNVKQAAKEFIEWMKSEKRAYQLKFSLDDITEDDYAYLCRHESELIELYCYDTGTNTLHYMYSKW